MAAIPGDTIVRLFTTRNPVTQVKVDADSLPTGKVYKNGVANAISVTVTNIETGLYKASALMAAGATANQFAIGDDWSIEIDATVDSVADQFIIIQDTFDDKRVGTLENLSAAEAEQACEDGLADYGAATATNVTNAHSTTDGKVDGVQTTVSNISNVVRLSTSLPTYMERGASNRAVKVEVALKDLDGNMEDPDGNQLALTVSNVSGTSRDANLYKDAGFVAALDSGSGTFAAYKKLVRNAEGLYVFYYKVEPAATEEELTFKYGWEEGSTALYEFGRSQVTDSANDLLAIKAKTDQLNFTGDDVKATLDNEKVQVSGIDTDAISAASIAAAAVAKIQNGLSTVAALAIVDAIVDAIKLKTDNLPASPAAVGSKMDLDEDENKVSGHVVSQLAAKQTVTASGTDRIISHKKFGDVSTEVFVETVDEDGNTVIT